MPKDMKIVFDPTEYDWKAYALLVNSDPNALYYATPDYLKMLMDVVGGRIVFYVVEEPGRWLAAIPALFRHGLHGSVINSLPFFGSNPGIVMSPYIMFPNDRREMKKWLIKVFWDTTANFFSATMIQDPSGQDKDLYDDAGWTFQDHRIGLMTRLDVPSLMDSFHVKTRNMIRKAAKSGITIAADLDAKQGIEIIRDLHIQNMSAIGAPIKPEPFFDWLLTNPKGLTVSVAQYKDEYVAGLILLRHNETVEYYMPAIHPDFRSFAPLNGLIYHEMKRMKREGAKLWNWGGTTMPAQEGVYRFKKRFGAVETKYTYYTRISAGTLKKMSPAEIKSEYPYYYVIPFSVLSQSGDFYGEDE